MEVQMSTAAAELRKHQPLELTVENSRPSTHKSDMMVVGVFADGTLTPAAEMINAASKGRLTALMKRGDLEDKPGSSLLLYDLPGTASQRVLLISLGARDKLDDKNFREALAGAAKALATSKAHVAAITLAENGIEVPGRSLAWRVQEAARILADGAYRFDAPTVKTNRDQPPGARTVALLTGGDVTPEIEAAARRGQAIADGMALTKDLGNLPANICTPAFLAEVAKEMGKEFHLDVDVLERADMAKLGMGSALSVGRGSEQPCKFIVVHYKGGDGNAKPVVLVGKGVTFDTGGISLKPGADLDMMKYDMCGAAAVLGALRTAAGLKLKTNLVGIVAAVENMPGGNASRPGDVVTSMSGQTIEILNTDAEGRLVLCDALTYAERFEPTCVIDVATLTGACVIALGNQTSGLYANDDKLGDELFDCGMATGDRAWRMPLWDEYQEQLKSNFADMSNLGGRPAGSVTAACFLSRFTKAYPWAHLDIAGTAYVGGDAKGATGRPVPLLSEFLLRRSSHAQAAT
jgi:leucyl aminopeptidase